MFKQLTWLLGKGSDQGFTLIEMLIVILIIGILAAVGVPLYIGYTQDAKLAEAKALAGSVLTAMQACVQTTSGANCTVGAVAGKVGLGTDGATGDGRWTVSGGPLTLTGNGGACQWGATSNLVVTGSKDVAGLTAQVGVVSGQIKMFCDTNTGGGLNPC